MLPVALPNPTIPLGSTGVAAGVRHVAIPTAGGHLVVLDPSAA